MDALSGKKARARERRAARSCLLQPLAAVTHVPAARARPQLRDPAALAGRLEDFLMTCVKLPDDKGGPAVFSSGHVTVDNAASAEHTVITVRISAAKGSSLQLLEAASTLTGLGLTIKVRARAHSPALPTPTLRRRTVRGAARRRRT